MNADTGVAAAYMAEHVLARAGKGGLSGKTCAVSGSDARSLALAKTLVSLGAAPLSFSDASGSIVEPEGFDLEAIQQLESMLANRGRLQEFRHVSSTAAFHASAEDSVWARTKGAQVAFPAVSNNEVSADDAASLAEAGCLAVLEVADRGCSVNAVGVLEQRGVVFAPSKLVTAVGSDSDLSRSALGVLEAVQAAGETAGYKPLNLRAGSSVLAFVRVAAAMR
jgi:glutamate dehydrogenase (NADP+)